VRLTAESKGGITDLLTGESMSGAEMSAEILRRAGVRPRMGVGRAEHMVIAHGGTPSFFADLLAVWHLGAVAFCTNPALTRLLCVLPTYFGRGTASRISA